MSATETKVLVTGGAGFIGSHVAEAYLARGARVWVVDNLSTGKRENVPSGAEFVELDVRSSDLPKLFEEVPFDLVNHHAAQIDVRVSVADPCHDADVNVLGLLNLLEAARSAGTRRFLYVSSGGVVYGEPERRPTPEDAPKLPLSPYGVSKLSGELYLHYYATVHGLRYVALRYGNVFGPRQDPHGEAGVVAIFSSRLLEGTPLTIYGDGEQTRDYVYVHDVVAANMLLSDLDLPSGNGPDAVAFNVGRGEGVSVNRLAGLLEEISGARPGRTYAAERPGELRHSVLDTRKLRSFGWRTGWSLEEALRETYLYIANLTERTTEKRGNS